METSITLPEIDNFRKMDVDSLKKELVNQMGVSVTHLVRLASIVRVLEEKGENLAALRLGMLNRLRQIAYGQLLPDVVVALQASPLLLTRVATLPLPDQKQIVEQGYVEVAETDLEQSRRVPLLALARNEIMQVFGKDEIRGLDAQRNYLRTHQPRRAQAQQVDAEGIRVDRKAGGIRVGGVLISRRDLARYLAELTE